MNLYVLLASVLAALGLAGGAGYYGYQFGKDSVIAAQAKQGELLEKVEAAAQKGAATEIAKIHIRHTTIRQEVERETRIEPRYMDCRHTPAVLGLLNDALENAPAGTHAPRDRELPGPDPAP